MKNAVTPQATLKYGAAKQRASNVGSRRDRQRKIRRPTERTEQKMAKPAEQLATELVQHTVREALNSHDPIELLEQVVINLIDTISLCKAEADHSLPVE